MDLSETPDPLYIFTNTLNPTTWHNLHFVGSFSSAGWSTAHMQIEGYVEAYMAGTADFLPFVANPNLRGAISMYSMGAMNDYMNEYNAELARRKHYPLLPSRLSAVYAFGDYETCEQVANKYHWPLDTVMQFQLKSHDAFTRIARVNMEIVSLMRHSTGVGSMDAELTENVWRHYWSGGGSISIDLPAARAERKTFESGEIWEYLIEGRVDRIGGPLKDEQT